MISFVPGPAALQDVISYDEIQIANPTIGVQHLTTGLAIVRWGNLYASTPENTQDNPNRIYHVLRTLQAINNKRKS